MIDLLLTALWTVHVLVPTPPVVAWTNFSNMVYGDRFSFTPDVGGMSLEERRSYLDSIAQGPGGRR
jgi:hypothetical protein